MLPPRGSKHRSADVVREGMTIRSRGLISNSGSKGVAQKHIHMLVVQQIQKATLIQCDEAVLVNVTS